MTRPESYAPVRRRLIETITLHVLAAKPFPPPPPDGWWFRFFWLETDRMRDPDNVRAGGTKLILDALVVAGFMPGDSSRYVRGFLGDSFMYGRSAGVLVETCAVAGPCADWSLAIPHRLPGENEIGKLRELGARRSAGRGRTNMPASLAAAIAKAKAVRQ